MYNLRAKLGKGFTLIELLIVITIIGILAVALVPKITGAPANARDAGRKAAINNFQIAVETYLNNNGYYPLNSANGTTIGTVDCVQNSLAADIKSYMGNDVPKDLVASRPTSYAGKNCTGDYFYIALCTNDKCTPAAVAADRPSGYIVAASLEKGGGNNSTCATAKANCDDVSNADVADSDLDNMSTTGVTNGTHQIAVGRI